jgi:hypothetical protein
LIVVVLIAAGAAAVVHHALPSSEAAAAGGSLAAEHVPAQQIQSVSLDASDGTSGLPMGALRARLTTRVGQMLDATTLERDRAALEQELGDRGFLAARVAPPHVDFAPQGGAYVVFDIQRGPMFHLRKVAVTGPGAKEVGVVTLSEGDEVLVERLAHAKQAMVDTLARRSSKAGLEMAQQLDLAAAAVDLTIITR